MTWKVEFDDRARRELRRLDHSVQRQILRYLRKRIASDDDPRRFGRALRHDLQGFWRYRLGDCRIICEIQDEQVLILVVRVSHRRRAYR